MSPQPTPSVPAPSGDAHPCGPSLEYDPDYLMLLDRMAPVEEVQYGSFVGSSAAPDWSAIEREALRLLDRSQDIGLLACLCRSGTRLRGAAGLDQALARLLAVLQAWPDAVHPQTVFDGQYDPLPRANALAALADPQGLLADIAGIELFGGSEGRCAVGEVAAAFGLPRPGGAAAPEDLLRRMAAARAAEQQPGPGRKPTPLGDLARAAHHATAIDQWARAHLHDDAPPLRALLALLAPFAMAVSAPQQQNTPEPAPAAGAPVTQRSRADMRAVLVDARLWFETHEPSSPVAVLLLQAERLVGQRFAQVANALPPDLLKAWDDADRAATQVPR